MAKSPMPNPHAVAALRSVGTAHARESEDTTCMGLSMEDGAPLLVFKECHLKGYAPRTRLNAKADLTIAIARDYDTAGERLTRRVVHENGKAFCEVPYDHVAHGFGASEVVDRLNALGEVLGRDAVSVNIAGNGLYTLRESRQEQVDAHVYRLLGAVVEHPALRVRIASVCSGGQTGLDEAGVKAAILLGIPARIIAPKGWLFRGANGRDLADEVAFKARFQGVISQAARR